MEDSLQDQASEAPGRDMVGDDGTMSSGSIPSYENGFDESLVVAPAYEPQPETGPREGSLPSHYALGRSILDRRSYPQLSKQKLAGAASDWETVISDEEDASSSERQLPIPHHRSFRRDLYLDLRPNFVKDVSAQNGFCSSLNTINCDTPLNIPRRTTIMIPPNFSRPRLVDIKSPSNLQGISRTSFVSSSSLYSDPDDEAGVGQPSHAGNYILYNNSARVLTTRAGRSSFRGAPPSNARSNSSSSVSGDPFKFDGNAYSPYLQPGMPPKQQTIHSHLDVPRDPAGSQGRDSRVSRGFAAAKDSTRGTSFYNRAAIRST